MNSGRRFSFGQEWERKETEGKVLISGLLHDTIR